MTAGTEAGIVTTLRDVGPSLDSFIAYHLAIGFSHLFLFFDDPADPDLARCAAHPAITVIARDAALERAWQALPDYQTYGESVGSEVMARQVLNAAIAMDMARARGLAWLLHIDADELFFSPEGSCTAHFDAAARQNARSINYLNHEAMPEEIDAADPFRAVSLFKLSTDLLPPPDAACQALLQRAQFPPERFHFYRNGKSAVRLDAAEMRPQGVHEFGNPAAPAPQPRSRSHFILHYACCGFELFWRKYRLLGRFSDKWFGKYDIRDFIGTFHLDARDVVAGGDRDKALAFYRQRFVMEDRELSEALIRHGVMARFPQPRLILDRTRGA